MVPETVRGGRVGGTKKNVHVTVVVVVVVVAAMMMILVVLLELHRPIKRRRIGNVVGIDQCTTTRTTTTGRRGRRRRRCAGGENLGQNLPVGMLKG